MVIARLIERKRDGGTLSDAEWRELITQYADGAVPDYQMSALAMAILFRGLDAQELVALTDAMLHSGATLSRPDSGPPRIDKHSTGGVGDLTSLVLAPMLATLGVHVPMMSGRGLGHTGGTLDKLESIPGFRTAISLDDANRQLNDIGVVMFGQTNEIAPADRRLYALRDVTGTVESIPLIAASIMSKKLAEGLDGLVLDVKVGSGAFLPGIDRARQLARTMVALGTRSGCRTVARLTAMDRPLARTAGNALEVREAIAALRGEREGEALMQVTYALGVEMVQLAGLSEDDREAHALLHGVIADGRAAERFAAVIARQGGDPRVIDRPDSLPLAPVRRRIKAGHRGILPPLPPRPIGEQVVELGGGRRVSSDPIDPAVGIEFLVPPGTPVEPGDQVIEVHARNEESASRVSAALSGLLESAWTDAESLLPLLLERVERSDTLTPGVVT